MNLAHKIKKAKYFLDFFGIWKKSVKFRENLMHFQQKIGAKIAKFQYFA
jgi:hypothetical protein